ncbi:hypothetical protein IWQ60_010671 [Tieghemiomyces parasiticus]|uniref:Pentacotripeptide-repeat region of PRORP domain-containing protein n=1 Tax=Tieghemiomyces parasiticus TaxID=78921 RepID=A0A9W7ZSE5_9FUNG|nr:hypothetical protein IWQ60_010671 [Tieghemiomyces parasiticus]
MLPRFGTRIRRPVRNAVVSTLSTRPLHTEILHHQTSLAVQAHRDRRIATLRQHLITCSTSFKHCSAPSTPRYYSTATDTRVDPIVARLREMLEVGGGQDTWLAYISVRNAELLGKLTVADFERLAVSQTSLLPPQTTDFEVEKDEWARVYEDTAEKDEDGAATAAATAEPPYADLVSPTLRTRLRTLCKDWLAATVSPLPTEAAEVDTDYLPVLNVYATIGDTDSGLDLLRVVRKAGRIPTQAALRTQLSAFRNAGDAPGALEFYREVRGWLAGPPDAETLGRLVEVALETRDLTTARTVYTEVRDAGDDLPTVFLGRLARVFAQEGDRSFVHQLYGELQPAGAATSHGPIEEKVAADFIAAFGRLREPRRVQDLFTALHEGGARLGPHLFGTAINALADCGRFGDVDALYALMQRDQVPTSAYVSNNLMKAAFARGDRAAAMAIFQDLEARLQEPEAHQAVMLPTPHTYSIVITGLCQRGEVEVAEQILGGMLTHGLQPMRHMYNIIMGGHLRRNQYTRVITLFQRMIDHGVAINNYTAHIIMSAYTKSGDPEEATKLYQIFVEDGLKPNIYTYSTALRAYAKSGQMTRALALFEEMIVARVYPNLHSYTIMIKGFADVRDSDGVHLVHRLFNLDTRVEPNMVIYNALLDAYNRVDSPIDAFQMWELIVLHGFPIDNCTVSVALDACAHPGYLIHIQPIIELAHSRGVRLNINNFTSLVETYFRQGQPSFAIQVLAQDMVAYRMEPDAKFLSTLLRFLVSYQREFATLAIDACLAEHFPRTVPIWNEIKSQHKLAKPRGTAA